MTIREKTVSLLLALALVACGPAQTGTQSGSGAPAAGQGAGAQSTQPAQAAFPVTVMDDTGRQVQVKAEPKRIVSGAPSNTEILYALGLGDKVQGVTNFCNYPEEAKSKPKVGGLRPNLEAIVAQQPDLVLVVRGTPAETISALEGQGVPVAVLNPADFNGVLANITMVGRLTGAAAKAAELTSQMQRRWNAVAERARTATRKPRVFFEVDATDPASVSAAGPGTFIDAMITAAGGVNVMAQLTPGQQYPKVNAEAILQADPDLIVLGDAPFGQSAETLARRPGWNALQALQKGAVVGISAEDVDITSRAGPRLVDGLERVAKLIQPEVFR